MNPTEGKNKKIVAFVCLGNICRSPAARNHDGSRRENDLQDLIEVDSAGTSGWHEESYQTNACEFTVKRG